MESTACDVHHHDRHVDVVDVIPPAPTSIKDQMPGLANVLQQLAANMGREFVQKMVKASVELRAAYEADDFQAVNALYRSGSGWLAVAENGYFMGVPESAMKAFALRHRRAR